MKKVVVVAAIAVALIIGVIIGGIMTDKASGSEGAKYTLSTYKGVGSGVLKHGTIVQIKDGQPVVVGHFDDETGAEFPGTLVLEDK